MMHENRKCDVFHGEGRRMEKINLKVQIPAGIEDKTVLRLSGKGEAGSLGSPSGDLYVRVNVGKSNIYDRNKQDLYYKLKVDLLQSILGDKIEINTPYGKKEVKIPGGTHHKELIKFKGEGLTKVGGYEKGDFYIELHVEMPTKLSKKELEIYAQLAKDKGLKIDPQIKSGWL